MKIQTTTVKQARRFCKYLDEMGVTFRIVAQGVWEDDRGELAFCWSTPVKTLMPRSEAVVAHVDGECIRIRPVDAHVPTLELVLEKGNVG